MKEKVNEVYLCGHTGSINRGCEAIVRSTSELLYENDIKSINLLSFDAAYDKLLGIGDLVNLISYPPKNFYAKAMSVLKRKFTKDITWGGRYVHKDLKKSFQSRDLIFNIGGDTYCYGTPTLSYALNEVAAQSNIPTVFWGCSVDEHVLTDSRMQEDILSYSYIVARESISYDRLLSVVGDPKKVFLTCDPAFWLKSDPIDLPSEFVSGNMVGINVSPLVIEQCCDDNIMCQNAFALIDGILNNTDMGVCLIPHVYDPDTCVQDASILAHLYERYKHNARVVLISDRLSCCQLKYIISKCRFFVGARTHSVIAAYSSEVPALAISYSIKSIGIAKDIFGANYNRYVVEWEKIKSPDELWKHAQILFANEAEVRSRYKEILPDYKKTIKDALHVILGDLSEK